MTSQPDISTTQKCEFLKEAYSRVYANNHFVRERIIKICMAALGIMAIAVGWCITIAQEKTLAGDVKGAVIAAILVILAVACYSCYGHYREYLGSTKLIVRLERAMGFYKYDLYLPSESLYEPQSQEWGRGRTSSHMIAASILSMGFFGVFAVVLIIML